MAAVWLLLAKARFSAELIESSRDHGVRVVEAPFDIAADFLPDLLQRSDQRMTTAALAGSPTRAQFGHIVYRSEQMARLVARAQAVAPRSIPVLLLGESGTGKELFARAIHASGPRDSKPFVVVNCGAIPTELVESTLFGHEKGAFTGASDSRGGVFESADGGTLFLDELGDLPLAAQVKLLRVLQDGEVQRVGSTRSRKVRVRVLAATHRDLLAEVRAGRFREDLFYRIAVAVLRIPPLRERQGDLGLLVDHLWLQACQDAAEDPLWLQKTISVAARQALLSHSWPGNVRELLNTLHRLVVWGASPQVSAADVDEALLEAQTGIESVLNRQLGVDFSMQSVLDEVAAHYLRRALAESGGNLTAASKLVGLSSYQTLKNWMARVGVAE